MSGFCHRPLQSDLGYQAWLRWQSLENPPKIPRVVICESSHPLARLAATELRLGLEQLLGEGDSSGEWKLELSTDEGLLEDGFAIDPLQHQIRARTSRGLIYGVFALLRALAVRGTLPRQSVTSNPSAPIRFLNHWDNLDGTIERGYAGPSLFYAESSGEDWEITPHLDRVTDYARLLASIGINGCSLNNVNADDRALSQEGIQKLATLADALRVYGVQSLISIRLNAPMSLGGLKTFDPLSPKVREWWHRKACEVYDAIPDLAGWVLKADSEGSLGPTAYERTHAQAANLLADALEPHEGRIFYRGFVYNHKMDWRDLSLDRAKAQQDNFLPLNGQFAENAVIQIKNGPIDFQVREPVSPSFASLDATNTVVELMITQEYLGQQHHTVYEVPWWKDSLDFDFELPGRPSRLQDIVTGKVFPRSTGGFIGVAGTGSDTNWMGNHLAQANLYGFGRLSWDPELSSEEIAHEWIAQTLTRHEPTAGEINRILQETWPTYEAYTGNLGIGGLTQVIHIHYGPAPDSSEHNGWGQWHRSNERGTGMNRTVQTGTGFAGQYPATIAARFESLTTCPEELLLFFQHVPYDHTLRNGKRVIQHIYDEHWAGAARAQTWVERWAALEEISRDPRFLDILDQLEYQAGHAEVWRDTVCDYFFSLCGHVDERIERSGLAQQVIHPASHLAYGYEIIEHDLLAFRSRVPVAVLPNHVNEGMIQWTHSAEGGEHEISIQVFDQSGSRASLELLINGFSVATWHSGRRLPSDQIDTHTKTRWRVASVMLNKGDTLSIVGRKASPTGAAIERIKLRSLGR